MNYKLNAKLKVYTYRFDGVVHIENDDKLPYFVLDYINSGVNTIDKMKNKLGTLSENRVKFLLYDYMHRYKIINIENDNLSITDTGNIYFDTETSFSPKYADFSLLVFNDVVPYHVIDIIIEQEKEEDSREFKDAPLHIICGNRQSKDELFNKECIIQGNFLERAESVINVVIEDDIIEFEKNYQEVKIDYSSEITINHFVEQVRQQIKDMLLEYDLWSEEDDKFIPNIEMLETGDDFNLDKENFMYSLESGTLDIKKNNGEDFEIECDKIKITNFQIAPDENTSIFWFLYELRKRVTTYITTDDIEQVIKQINYELSEKYKLYEAFEYDIDELLDILVTRKEDMLFRYINTCIDLPVDGI